MPADPGQPSNLWQPVDQAPGSDHGAHGSFDDKSHPRSAQLTVTERVEQAGASVRSALGSLLGAARPRPQQQAWSAATSQQTDTDALPSTPPLDAGPPPVDHEAHLADHDTSVPGIDASLPEESAGSGVDEEAPSDNRHSFLDDIETPLSDQDGRSADEDVPGADLDLPWGDQGIVPPTQRDAPLTADTAPPTGDPAPLDLEGLSKEQP